MTHVSVPGVDSLATNGRASAARTKVIRGFAGLAILTGIIVGAVGAPVASPATVVAPANVGLSLSVSRQARAAWLASMHARGYELVAVSADRAG